MPPLGLGWIAAVLEQAGHEVRILDAHAEQITMSQIDSALSALGTIDMVGVTATTAQIDSALSISTKAKMHWPASIVVLGGVHPTVLPDEVLSHYAVDVVVRGEGELTMLDLAAHKPLQKVPGVSYRDDGNVVHNPDRKLVTDLDSLPFPAYHRLPMSRYYPAKGAYKRLPAISMLGTRGCVGKCTFCFRMFGARVRVRSGRLIAEEVKFLQERYGIKEICFYDDTFTFVKKEVYAFCAAISVLGIDITWSCFSRVDAVDEDLLLAMKDAGCHQIMFGIESGSCDILQTIRKGADLEMAMTAVRAAKKARIDVRAAFMIGNPGETRDSMEETLRFAIRLDPELAVFNIATPFPGTEMFDWAKSNGYLTTRNWKDYDPCHPVMKLPTVSREEISRFYQRAYRRFYLRPRYILRRLWKLRTFSDVGSALIGLRGVLGI